MQGKTIINNREMISRKREREKAKMEIRNEFIRRQRGDNEQYKCMCNNIL